MITNPTSKNRLILIKNGNHFLHANLKLIQSAKRFILLHTYIFEDDELTAPIIQTLIEASERGVKVFILVDGFGSRAFPQRTIDRFKQAGIFFDFFMPLIRLKNIGRRLHQKMLIIDNKIAIMGGINLSKRFNNPQEPWLDYSCCIEGEEVHNLYRKVIHHYLMNFKKQKDLLTSFSKERHFSNSRTLVKTNENDFIHHKQEVYHSYINAIAHARKEITILATYFIPGKKTLKQLKKAAHHNVKVKLIFGGFSDHPWARLASKYLYEWYLKNHIEIYEWDESIIHGKLALVDNNWVTIGSYNHNFISRYRNVELNFEVINKQFAATVRKEFKHILEKSRKVELDDLQFNLSSRIKTTLTFLLLNIITLFSIIFLFKEDESKDYILK